jgi:hypothetical protein
LASLIFFTPRVGPRGNVCTKEMFYEDDAVDAVCPARTVDDLLAAHAAAKWGNVSEVDDAHGEIRAAFARLHAMRAHAEDARVAEAMAETCRLLNASSDAMCLRERHKLDEDARLEEQGRFLDVSRFPMAVTYDPTPADVVPPWRCRVHAMPTRAYGLVEFSAIAPHHQVLLSSDVLRGKVGVYVFRAPNRVLTRVEDGTIYGMASESCALFLSNDVSQLEVAARRTTLRYGATWVWVHCMADHFAPGPRSLRAQGKSTIVLERGQSLLLQRRDFGWHLVRVTRHAAAVAASKIVGVPP